MATSQGPIGGWYTSLKPKDEVPNSKKPVRRRALFLDLPRTAAVERFVVYSMRNGFRNYAAFASSVDFYLYYRNLYEREFHEVIFGEKPQKARFDIDLTPENLPPGKELLSYGNLVRAEILEAVAQTLQEYKLSLDLEKDVAICVSHSVDLYLNQAPTANSKYSCHVIISKYYHYNHEEAAEFFKLVVAKSDLLKDATEKGILDRGIFGSLKSFRIFGSSKDGARVKTLLNDFQHKDRLIVQQTLPGEKGQLLSFRRTIITDTAGCTYIPVILPIKEDKYSSFTLPVGTSDQALDLLKNTEGFDLPYKVESVSGGLVLLKRTRASECRLCNRVHETENPYLRVTSNGNVYFYCRRASPKNNNYRVGRISVGAGDTVDVSSILASGMLSNLGGTSFNPYAQPGTPSYAQPMTQNQMLSMNSSGGASFSDYLPTTPQKPLSASDESTKVIIRRGCDFRELQSLSRQFAPRGLMPQSGVDI